MLNVVHSDLGNNSLIFYDKIKKYHNTIMVDLGVRSGCSSSIMLEDAEMNQNKVIGVDVENVVDSSVLNHPLYRFIQSDSCKASLNLNNTNISVLFVDTLHIKEQVLKELYHWMPLVADGGLVVFHDTNRPLDKNDFRHGRIWDRPEEAIKSYFNIDTLNTQNDFITVSHFPESWGMTFVEIHKQDPNFGSQVNWSEVLAFE